MRLFRRAREGKPSVIGREAVSSATERASTPSIVPPSRPSSPVALVGHVEHETPPAPLSQPDFIPEDSDVFVSQQDPHGEAAAAATEVTLFVHGWHQVEPGLLSWTFPSLGAAVDAVQRMRNAIGWCIVSGTGWDDLDAARARGAILVEQLS